LVHVHKILCAKSHETGSELFKRFRLSLKITADFPDRFSDT